MEAKFEKNRKIKASCILQQILFLDLERAKKEKRNGFIGKTLVLRTHRNCRTKRIKSIEFGSCKKALVNTMFALRQGSDIQEEIELSTAKR